MNNTYTVVPMKIHFTLAILRVISFFHPGMCSYFLVIRPVEHKDNLFRSSVNKSVLLFNTYYSVQYSKSLVLFKRPKHFVLTKPFW